MVDVRWTDLLDPDEATLAAALPEEVHPSALARLRAVARHDDEPRPRLESHGNHVFGVFVTQVLMPEDRRIVSQEIDVLATSDRLITVRKTPPDGPPFLAMIFAPAHCARRHRRGCVCICSLMRSRSGT